MDQKPIQTSGSILFLGIIIVLVLFLIKFFDISYPISVTNRSLSGELSVVGEGKVDVVPDTAEVSAGIVVQDAKTVQEAEQKINEVNNKIIAAAIALGIPKEDIKTSNYSISPDYRFEPAGGRSTQNTYTGNATVTIKVKDANKVSGVISAATTAGANQVYNAGFSVDDPGKFREQARSKAIQNAKEQAQKLASQLGIRLGKIVNIVESTPETPMPFMEKRLAIPQKGGLSPNIEPGTQTISSTVTLYFERN